MTSIFRFLKEAGIWLYGFIFALFIFIYFLMIRLSCRYQIEGKENLDRYPNFILAGWHRDFTCTISNLYLFHRGGRVAWMMHPLSYMKPFHIVAPWIGVTESVLGSSGHSGKQALEVLIQKIKEGCSTDITPDGPGGPPRELKPGVMRLASQSGAPVIAVAFQLFPFLSFWWAWDKKRFPLPFSKIRIKISEPIFVRSETDDEARGHIIQGLSAID